MSRRFSPAIRRTLAAAALLLATLLPSLLWAQAAAPIVVKSADFPRPAALPLGVNLEAAVDFAHSMMFVDMIKSARQFGSADAPWDKKAAVDAEGWPTGDAGTVVAADTAVPPGDYLFSCTGRCEVGIGVSHATVKGQVYHRDTDTTTAVITVDNNADQLFLSFKRTTGGVKNIRLLRPGYPLNTDQVFGKDFLKALEPFTTLRLMDFARTNDTPVREWADRAKPTDALQSSNRGTAWEYGIQLANQTGKDIWINIPAEASDDYVKQLAQLLLKNLDPKRAVYVEYSNEVWNSVFPQFHINLDLTQAEIAAGGGKSTLDDNGQDHNKYYVAWKRVAKRLVEISDIFKGVYPAGSINTRVRPVLASQAAQPVMLRKQVQYIEKYVGPPNQFIYGVAGAPYLAPEGKVSGRAEATADELLASAGNFGMKYCKDAELQYQVIARYYRLHPMCYEGGPAFDKPVCVTAEIAANRDPRMGKLIQDYLNAWYGTGGELFMYFNLAGSYGKYGSWGLTEDIRVATAKTRAIQALKAAAIPAETAGAAIPGVISAGEPDAHEMMNVEAAADGSKHLIYLKNDEWFDYLLNVTATGDYALTLQTGATQEGARVEVLMSGQSVGTVAAKNTGDWKKWGSTDPVLIHLEKGQIVLRLRIVNAGLNIQSITIQKP